MDDTSAVPFFSITLGSETRTLRYGFRAFKILNLSPFRPSEVMGYLGTNLDALDVDKAAAWVRAGLAWEYAKDQPRYGQELPTVDELVDLLDLQKFMDTFSSSLEVAGLKPDPDSGAEAEPQADPPPA
jgi:hypothetical protein